MPQASAIADPRKFRQKPSAMRFSSKLLPGKFLRRYKRFFVDVELDDGSIVTAHCANSGRMTSCYSPNGRVWLSREDDPQRKLKYTWQLSKVGQARICVHSVLANRLTREAIEAGIIGELVGYRHIAMEPRMDAQTRFDLLLSRGTERCFVEVKSATLSLGDGRIAFPDAVSTRASKHLRELVKQAENGHRAVIFFCANRTDAQTVEPADPIDPEYGQALRWALSRGVEALAYRAAISTREIALTTRIPVNVARLALNTPPKTKGKTSLR